MVKHVSIARAFVLLYFLKSQVQCMHGTIIIVNEQIVLYIKIMTEGVWSSKAAKAYIESMITIH